MRRAFLILGLLIFAPCVNAFKKPLPYLSFSTENRIIYDICFTKKGGTIYIADGEKIKIYNSSTAELKGELINGHTKPILSMDISTDSTTLASGGKDGKVIIWNLNKGIISKTLSYHNGVVLSVKISPDKKYIVSGDSDGLLVIYDFEKEEIQYKIFGNGNPITSVDFNPNHDQLAVANGIGPVKIYDLNSGQVIRSYENNTWIRSVVFNQDGSELYYAGDNHVVYASHISNYRISKINVKPSVFSNWILSLDTHYDNTTYVLGDLKGVVRIDTPFGESFQRLNVPINKVIFVPNTGSDIKIAVATRAKGVMLLEAGKMKLLR